MNLSDPFDTLIVFLKEFFEKVLKKKVDRQQELHKKVLKSLFQLFMRTKMFKSVLHLELNMTMQ